MHQINTLDTELRCLACDQTRLVTWFTKSTNTGQFPVARCLECGSAFVWPRPGQAVIDAHYESRDYSNLTYEQVQAQIGEYFPTSNMDAQRVISRCHRLTPGRDFLDVGAGNGEFSEAALSQGCRVHACEPNPNSRAVFLHRNGFEADARFFDTEYAQAHLKSFDIVLLSQVLEHLIDIHSAVANIHAVLRKGGIAAIAVPHRGSALSILQGRNDMFISPPEHLNFFSRKGLVSLFERNGFELAYLETVSKVPQGKIRSRLRNRLLGTVVSHALYACLRFFDCANRGMVLNAYFRRK